jgi:HemY protein
MRRVLFILAALAAFVALAWWLAFLPGTVTASALGYSIEAAAPVALVGGVVLLGLLLLLLRLLLGLFGLPGAVRFWSRGRRRRKGDAAVSRALVALAAGDAARSRREARRAQESLGDTPQTLLLLAESARLAGDHMAAAAHYKVLAAREDGAFLGLRGLFRQAVEREDWKEAAALARRAEALQPAGTWLREARLRLAEETGNWSGALALAGPDLPEEAVAAAAAVATDDPVESARLARLAWRANPGFAPGALAHAAALRRQGRDDQAEAVVLEAWRAAPHPDLAAFLLADTHDAKARLQAATRLSNVQAEHVETQLLLGRLSLEAGELRDARFHGERALGLAVPTRRVHRLLADIAAAEGGDPMPALRAAAEAPDDPAWHCGQCGAVQAKWHPVCPACHAPARMAWGLPVGPKLLTSS